MTASSILLRLILLMWGLWSLWVAAMCFIDLSMAGFPDGHLTPWDQVVNGPLEAIAWLTAVSGFYFVFRAWRASRAPAPGAMILQLALAAVLTVLPIWLAGACPHWDNCGQAYQALTGEVLDDGSGG